MTTEAKIQITSTELGTLWMSYLTLSETMIMCDLLKDKIIDKDAKNIFITYGVDIKNTINEIVNIFNSEKVIIPVGFGEHDIMREAPPLFDDIFCIMFLRHLTQSHLGHSAVFTTISYKQEVYDVLRRKLDLASKYYMITTNYLLGKGVLARPPYITMPKQVEFIEDNNYMSGFNAFSEKRSLNTIEVGFINETIESNIFNMQLLTGFAQVAKENEVKKHFEEGKELSKKTIKKLSGILLQSDIQPPSAWAGKATDSTEAPFSDKLMMFTDSLSSSTPLGFTELGAPFNMRKDLPVKLALISKDTFEYSKKGAKIMIKHKWMEEPPQMEDRNQLTK
jgi:hypothetical protein